MVGRYIKYYRLKRGYTIEDCVFNTGLSSSNWSKYESGVMIPRPFAIERICNFLKVSPDILFREENKVICINAIASYLETVDQNKVLDAIQNTLNVLRIPIKIIEKLENRAPSSYTAVSMDIYAERLKHIRTKLGFTQQALRERVGYSEEYFSFVETVRKPVTTSFMLKASIATGYSIVSFFADKSSLIETDMELFNRLSKYTFESLLDVCKLLEAFS